MLQDEVVQQLRLRLTTCEERIRRTRENGDEIIEHLGALIDEVENEEEFKFSWAVSHYRYPPTKKEVSPLTATIKLVLKDVI